MPPTPTGTPLFAASTLPSASAAADTVAMSWLFAASLLWAFSFGLIKRFLPELDAWQVAAARLLLATVAFAPWLVRRAPSPRLRWRAAALGAVQFGAMYTFYIASFRHLAAWQVALWTVFTPIFVVLLSGLARGRVDPRPWLAAMLAVAGALLAQGQWPRGDTLTGILLVQVSNLCFAAGQLGYRALDAASAAATASRRGREAGLLGWMYLGGALFTLPGALVLTTGRSLTAVDAATVAPVLLYLGLVPTAVGFWLWNRGAARTSAPRLAVANNLKVPLAVLVSWLVFGESTPYLRAAGGLAVIAVALALVGRREK